MRSPSASAVRGPGPCHPHRVPAQPVRGGYEICPVCFWEDDGQGDQDADAVPRGPPGRWVWWGGGMTFEAERAALLEPGRLWSAGEVLGKPGPVPGVYGCGSGQRRTTG